MNNLLLNKNLFSMQAVVKSIDDYSKYASIVLEENVGYWNIIFDNCVHDKTLTMREFENYVIGLEVKLGITDEDL